MKKSSVRWMIGIGIFCILAMVLSVWYAVTFNDSRLVVPTDLSTYVFQVKDLPMIISGIFVGVYAITLVVMLLVSLIRAANKNDGEEKKAVTRKLNPKLGYLGFLGLLGFMGFWTYRIDESIFPFAFFIFFGFFGFYYEGKMSGTFMDERFQENAVRAQLKALKVTCSIIFIALIVFCRKTLFGNLDYTLIAIIIVLSLALALGLFLSEYLLYRYDHDEQCDESGE